MFPYKDNALYGSTIEIQYTALDIGFDDARILDYTDIETPFKGIFVDIGRSFYEIIKQIQVWYMLIEIQR